jgi:hypothetical protein
MGNSESCDVAFVGFAVLPSAHLNGVTARIRRSESKFLIHMMIYEPCEKENDMV